MEVTEGSFHLLASFPPDIIGEIFNGAGRSHLVLEMWKCGDRAFNAKLAVSVTNIDLQRHTARVPFPFPTLVSQFHSLRSLCMMLSGSAKEKRFDLKSLPQTLERLELQSLNSFTAFFNYAPDSTTSEPKYIETDYPRGRSRLIDLNTLFPHLHTLRMTPRFDRELRFAETDFAALPASLTCLKLSEITSTGHFMRSLPRTLQRIEAEVTWATDSEAALDWQSAPPSLEYIRGLDSPHWTIATQGLSHVPRSLTCEHIAYSEWTLTLSRTAPDNLEEITNVHNMDEASFSGANWVSELPKGLKKLEAGRPLYNLLGHLPRSLTYLANEPYEKEATDWRPVQEAFSHEVNAFWPPGLTYLRMSLFELDHIKLLPRTLETMSLTLILENAHDQKVLVNGNDFPSQLTDLSFYPPNVCTSFGISGTIPTTLTRFTAAGSSCALENETLAKLPQSLSSLLVNLPLNLTMETIPQYIGAQLTHLHVGQWPVASLGAVPRHLTSLTVLNLTNIETHDPTTNLTESLPTSLHSMQLYSEQVLDGVTWSARSFENLPNLRHLTASGRLPAFESGVLRSLSRKLTNLTIRLATLDPCDLPFFPPGLHHCTLNGDIDWSMPELVEHWPLTAHGERESLTPKLVARVAALYPSS